MLLKEVLFIICQKVRIGAGIGHTRKIERGRLTIFVAALPFRPKRI